MYNIYMYIYIYIYIYIYVLVMTNLFQQIMCYENIMKWKNKENALKFLWNILHKNNENL